VFLEKLGESPWQVSNHSMRRGLKFFIELTCC